ncbi:heavy metal translocating P-type ATPase [Alkalicoccus daliensis]|uniref:Cd2+/Zn2+-exporting ATPase n=1 Tax=Alkalicoccus daliensis TaxID=745820 RepID=A0A1H0KBN1_9BACI|nr:heavy metal translocating P-type ATPase [Alkalicoccus daliensis]SDO53348.1 Cd2+/Zn2+-exporting ATPase [Alkalicoccus daliensis]
MNIADSAVYTETKLPVVWKHRELFFALGGGLFLLLGIFTASPAAALFFYLLSYVCGGYFKTKEGLEDLITDRKLNVEILMILAALGAASIGYWNEGAILIFIFAMSGALETYTLQKSEKDLAALVKLAPMEALRIDDRGQQIIVPVESLRPGDLIMVRNGERLPADGIVQNGISAVDEAAITGESVPVEKLPGDTVYNGTMNGSGTLTLKVTKENKDSLFQKMIQLVEEAQTSRPPSQKLIERIEGPYVITVLAVVFLMLTVPTLLFAAPFQETFYRAMVLLVVASPCAVVASIMPALLSAISTGARHGILTKGGLPLESLIKVKVVAVDKTGTLTKGEPAVTHIHMEPGAETQTALLEIVAGIEEQSSHPLAKAVTQYAEKYIHKKASIDTVKDITGFGVQASAGSDTWLVGNESLVSAGPWSRKAAQLHQQWMKDGHTVVFVMKNNTPQAIFALKDEVRKEAVKLVTELKRRGIHPVMITGDNEATAKAIAAETGIEEWISRCLPEQKVKEIEKLRSSFGAAAMIGDGINDAPAMAKADIGIAMGSGTDVAIDTADMVLMKSELSKIRLAFQLSYRLKRIIMQNLIFSIAVIALLITANFAQHLTLPLGVIGHEGSTILVILNGLRLLRS